MNKVWVFLGGVAVGVAGLVTTALVWDNLESKDNKPEDVQNNELIKLALPEGIDANK